VTSPTLSVTSIKRRICRYCMLQYYKADQTKVASTTNNKTNSNSSTISGYCPLDLFSADAIRIQRAITALMQSPQVYIMPVPGAHCLYQHLYSL
jgi:hypothetical protein